MAAGVLSFSALGNWLEPSLGPALVAAPEDPQASSGFASGASEGEGGAASTPFAAYFDFGTSRSPLSAGFSRVTDRTRYGDAAGYGWTAGTIRAADRRTRIASDRDLNFTADGTFVVDVPNGTYQVDLLLGDRSRFSHDQVGLYLEGAMVDVVTTSARQVVNAGFEIQVTDGQLTVRLTDLGGRDRYAAIEAMRVLSADPAHEHGATAWWPVVEEIPGASFSEPQHDRRGFDRYYVYSPYQRSEVTIRVLTPDAMQSDRLYPVIYVLPVESKEGARFGDGLMTVKRANLHNAYDAIFVTPSFAETPWYADHATNSQVRQETHFREVVVPFIEHTYSVTAAPEGRLLLGFSKSGYGAATMLLRHPDEFGRALAWDSPLGMRKPSEGWDFTKVLGSTANFENYRVTSLIQQQADVLQDQPVRLYLVGYGYESTKRDHLMIHQLMTDLDIPHFYELGVHRSHVWQSGWVPGAVDLLMS